MAYFWVLAFVFIPRATNLQSWLAENTVPLIIDFNTTINTTMSGLEGLDDTATENQVRFRHFPIHFCLKCTKTKGGKISIFRLIGNHGIKRNNVHRW
jgi:hypothetical protein